VIIIAKSGTILLAKRNDQVRRIVKPFLPCFEGQSQGINPLFPVLACITIHLALSFLSDLVFCFAGRISMHRDTYLFYVFKIIRLPLFNVL